MTKALDGLVELLDLETIEVDVFRGLSPDDDRQRAYQVTMPEVPDPEDLPTRAEQLAPWRDQLAGIADRDHAIDIRYVTSHPFAREPGRGLHACQQIWMRADGGLPDQQESPSGHGARAFARGSIFTRNGRLATSVTQEGLIRPLTR